jgi:hypothetical protein
MTGLVRARLLQGDRTDGFRSRALGRLVSGLSRSKRGAHQVFDLCDQCVAQLRSKRFAHGQAKWRSQEVSKLRRIRGRSFDAGQAECSIQQSVAHGGRHDGVERFSQSAEVELLEDLGLVQGSSGAGVESTTRQPSMIAFRGALVGGINASFCHFPSGPSLWVGSRGTPSRGRSRGAQTRKRRTNRQVSRSPHPRG